MGSPFNACEIRIHGDWIPQLPEAVWQDKHAESPDRRYVALVQWAHVDNNPGFRIVTIDTQSHSVSIGERNRGCCESLEWASDGLRWKAFVA